MRSLLLTSTITQSRWGHSDWTTCTWMQGISSRSLQQWIFIFLALLGFHSWRRIAIKVWFQWWRKWPVQCSHWCSCGHQWQHHRRWLGQQQNPGTAVHLRGACVMIISCGRNTEKHPCMLLNDHYSLLLPLTLTLLNSKPLSLAWSIRSIPICSDIQALLFFVPKPSGFWRKWLLLVLYQHISRPTVWTPRSGFDLRWPCSGGWLWQPLLQGLSLPPIMESILENLHNLKHYCMDICL